MCTFFLRSQYSASISSHLYTSTSAYSISSPFPQTEQSFPSTHQPPSPTPKNAPPQTRNLRRRHHPSPSPLRPQPILHPPLQNNPRPHPPPPHAPSARIRGLVFLGEGVARGEEGEQEEGGGEED